MEPIDFKQDENATLMLDQGDLDAMGVGKMGPTSGFSPSDRRKNVIEGYRHKGINTLYYLKPNTKNIYLLNFKKQTFSREPLSGQVVVP